MSDPTEYEKARAVVLGFIADNRAEASHLADDVGTPEAKREAKVIRWRATRTENLIRLLDERLADAASVASGGTA